jgi:AAA+ ATPase superfamily predicted ATPase
MKQLLVGRDQEKAILERAFQSDEPEMVAVYGRRRVGKTFLVRSTYGDMIDFEITGIQNGSKREQLQHFTDSLNYHARPILPFKAPQNWQEAFQMLIVFLESRTQKEKNVIFLDEFPWLTGRRSDFLKAFGLFWNSWASQNNIVVVICGSAASWMIANVMRNKGGLHNRVTRRVHLQPFNLYETEQFLKSRSVKLDRYQLLLIYMAMGGIPHYLKEIEAGKTAAQNIDQICFSPQGLLREEFSQLYPALFDNPENHIQIIRALSFTWQGLTRNEILAQTGLADGGTVSRMLEELIHSGFITSFYAFGKKKKELRYRLTDEYSLFYLKFIEEKRSEGRGVWERFSQTQLWKSWSGYAFESICLKHVPAIKKALGISGIYTEASAYYLKQSDFGRGIQIDLLIDRSDHAINIFEIKFYQSPFVLNKEQAQAIRQTIAIFKSATSTSKQVFFTLLSTFSLVPNEHSLGVIDKALDMNCLFEPID